MPIVLNNDYPGIPGTVLFGGLVTPSNSSFVTSFQLQNWNVSSSRTLFRGGMPFKKGDIPAGTVPEIRRGGFPIVAQFDERSTWADGSLKFAVCHLRDGDLAGMAVHDYEVYAVTGSYSNTGTKNLSAVTSINDLTLDFSSFNQWNGASATVRGSGAALASFTDHSATVTRVTKIHSGPVCEGWVVWGMVKDGADGSGLADAHLKVMWHVDIWKDASDSIIDSEFCAELAQNWWAVPDKFRLDYNVTLKRNGSIVQAYTGVQHPYRAHWATLRLQADNNNAKRHWQSSIPTLLYKLDKAYWVTTGVFPILDPDFIPDANTPVYYSPLSNLGHRTQIDGTGGYSGRGMITNIDAKAFLLQTPEEHQIVRTNAMVGLHYVGHFRDERERTRPDEAADVANTIVPLLLDPKPASASTFEGLPTPKHAYSDSRALAAFAGGYVAPLGGNGVWTPSGDSSHAPAFSTFGYMLEGEHYLLKSVIDMATKSIHVNIGNEFGGRPRLHWYNSAYARSEMSIPSNQWSGISDFNGQERSIGWSAMLLGYAAALVPDNDLEANYLRGLNSHNGDYMAENIVFMPPSLKEAGSLFLYISPGGPEVKSPWMSAIAVQGLLQNFRSTEVQGYRTFAAMAMNLVVAIANRAPYDLGAYRVYVAPKRGTYSADNLWYSSEDYLLRTGGTIVSNRLTINVVSDSLRYDIQTNDVIKFSASGASATATPVPPEYPQETLFYAVNPSGLSCDLALTPGGTPVSLSNGSYSIGGRFYGGADFTPATNPPYLPGGDTYVAINGAALAYSESVGLETVPPGSFAAVEAFQINSDRTTWPAWKLKLPI